MQRFFTPPKPVEEVLEQGADLDSRSHASDESGLGPSSKILESATDDLMPVLSSSSSSPEIPKRVGKKLPPAAIQLPQDFARTKERNEGRQAPAEFLIEPHTPARPVEPNIWEVPLYSPKRTTQTPDSRSPPHTPARPLEPANTEQMYELLIQRSQPKTAEPVSAQESSSAETDPQYWTDRAESSVRTNKQGDHVTGFQSRLDRRIGHVEQKLDRLQEDTAAMLLLLDRQLQILQSHR